MQNFNYEMPESIVIVRNQHGATATVRFKNPRFDRVLSSSSSKPIGIYRAIEDYVMGKQGYGKKEG